MTSPLVAGWEAVEAALIAADIPVITDPTSFTAPGVLVESPTVTSATLGAWSLSVPVVVVGEAPGGRTTLKWLLTTTEKVLDALDLDTADPSVFTLATQPFPAYRLTAVVTIARENQQP